MSKKFILAIFTLIFVVSCDAVKPKKVDTRQTPISGPDRARQNVESGGITKRDLKKTRNKF